MNTNNIVDQVKLLKTRISLMRNARKYEEAGKLEIELAALMAAAVPTEDGLFDGPRMPSEEKQLSDAKKLREYGLSKGDKELVNDMDTKIDFLTNSGVNSGDFTVFNQHPEEDIVMCTEDRFNDCYVTVVETELPDGSIAKQKTSVTGKDGVCLKYTTIDGIYTQYDPIGLSLLVNGFKDCGKLYIKDGLTGKQAKRYMDKYKMAEFKAIYLSPVPEGEHKYSVMYRKFGSAEAEHKAAEFIKFNKPTSDELQPMMERGKYVGALALTNFVQVRNEKTGMFITYYNGSMWYNDTEIKVLSATTPTDLLDDGEVAMKHSSFSKYGDEFKPYTRWTRVRGLGVNPAQKEGNTKSPVTGGLIKGMGTVYSVWPHDGYDCVLFDGQKKSFGITGTSIFTIGGQAVSGKRSYTDNMLCIKDFGLSMWALDQEYKRTANLLQAIMNHVQDNPQLTVMDKEINPEDPITKSLYALKNNMIRKEDLKDGELFTNSHILNCVKAGIDPFKSPLFVNMAITFLLGDEGKKVSKYRVAVPNAVTCYMVVYKEEFMPKNNPLLPYPPVDGSVITVVDGVAFQYCSREVWPSVREKTGGSDGDDAFQNWLFKLKKALESYLGKIFRQPDGPGDGDTLSIVLRGGAENLFDVIPEGKQAKTFLDAIDSRISKIWDSIDIAKNIEADKAAKKAENADKRGGYAPMEAPKMKLLPGVSGMVKLPAKLLTKAAQKELDKKIAPKETSKVWWKFNSIVPKTIGETVNTNGVVAVDTLDDYNFEAGYLLLANMVAGGFLEIVIDFDNKGAGTEDQFHTINRAIGHVKRTIKFVEYSLVIGESKGFKPRITSCNGVNFGSILKMNVNHIDTFNWPIRYAPKGVKQVLTTEVEEIKELAKQPGMTVDLSAGTQVWTSEGKEGLYKIFGITLYKGDLTAFYNQLRFNFQSGYVSAKQISLYQQVSWYNDFLITLDKDHGINGPEAINKLMIDMVGSTSLPIIAELMDLRSSRDISYEDKFEYMHQAVLSSVSQGDMMQFFKNLVVSDLFQMNIKGEHAYSMLVNRGSFQGWISKARYAYDVLNELNIVQEKLNRGETTIHDVVTTTVYPEIAELLTTGLMSEQFGEEKYQKSLFDWMNLRSFNHMPTGRSYKEHGTEKKGLEWLVYGKHWQVWYAEAHAAVCMELFA